MIDVGIGVLEDYHKKEKESCIFISVYNRVI
jgi:hypothetical protein